MKVNLAKKPFIPDGFTLESHIPGDKAWEFDASKIELFVSEKQKVSYQLGTELQKEVPNPFNANLLDFLLDHQKLIPDDWKKYYGVYFCGTIYRNSGGNLCVRFLFWSGGRWYWSYRWLDFGFGGSYPAACPASNSKTLGTSSPLDFSSEEVKKLKEFVKLLK